MSFIAKYFVILQCEISSALLQFARVFYSVR